MMKVVIRKKNDIKEYDVVTFAIGTKKSSMILPNNAVLVLSVNDLDEIIIKVNNNDICNTNNDTNNDSNYNTNINANTNKGNRNNSNNRCPNCSNELITQEGCQVCMNCYYSTCSLG